MAMVNNQIVPRLSQPFPTNPVTYFQPRGIGHEISQRCRDEVRISIGKIQVSLGKGNLMLQFTGNHWKPASFLDSQGASQLNRGINVINT